MWKKSIWKKSASCYFPFQCQPAFFPTLNLCFVIEQSSEHRVGELEVYAEVT